MVHAEVIISQKKVTETFAFFKVLRIESVAGFLEQTSEYTLASTRLISSQHYRGILISEDEVSCEKSRKTRQMVASPQSDDGTTDNPDVDFCSDYEKGTRSLIG